MGMCASSNESKNVTVRRRSESNKEFSSTIKVIKVDGKLQEFKKPIKASTVISQNSDCFLCSSESMSIGKCVPQVDSDEELKAGQVYFVLPLSEANKPLTLPDLCGLAVKAHSAIANHSVDFSYSFDSKFIFQ